MPSTRLGRINLIQNPPRGQDILVSRYSIFSPIIEAKPIESLLDWYLYRVKNDKGKLRILPVITVLYGISIATYDESKSD